MNDEQRMRVVVLVLGDVGRSPRMQYHALALADAGADVDLIGYSGCPLPRAIEAHERVTCHFLPPPPTTAGRRIAQGLFLSDSLLRIVTQSAQLLRLLFTVPRPHCILVQTPPTIPTLVIALAVARLRSAKLVIDWHNLGYAMLGLRLGQTHSVVRLARWYEHILGRCADAHFCVSRALQVALAQEWGIHATVLYDGPAHGFAPTASNVRRALFQRLRQEIGFLLDAEDADPWSSPAIIVSATSWTADEDFDLLLDAVTRCDASIEKHDTHVPASPFPPLVVLITGEGPLRTGYEARIRQLVLRKVRLRTLWLSPEDYPLLLGAAHLGVCVHRSASGLDLPMKVADMFGSGLPVCALDYGPCLAEAVRHGENGLLFKTSAELAEQLYELFDGFPRTSRLLCELRGNVERLRFPRWSDNWTTTARPVFAALVPPTVAFRR